MPDGSLLPVSYRPDRAPAVRVLAWPHPLRVERIEAILPAGGTIVDLLDTCEFPEALRPSAQVWIADAAMRTEPLWVPAQLWRLVRPKAGTVVTVRVVPGKKGGKGLLGILFQIVTAAVGFLVPGIGGVLLGFGLKLLGSVLIPKPKAPKSSQGGGVAASPTYSVAGSRNQANPYAPVPRLYGRHRMTPPLGALPFTEIVGDDQFLRLVFCFGYGPLLIEDIRIGETPLTSFDDVEYEVRQGYATDAPLTLYTQDVFEVPLSVELTNAGGPSIQVSQANADEISVDITFDQGLASQNNSDDGMGFATAAFTIEYRLFGSGGAWTLAGSPSYTGASRSLLRRGLRWTLATRGQYEVQITRLTADDTGGQVLSRSVWSALRSIRQTVPIVMSGLALVAVRIRASDQLNGVVDQFNAIATAMVPTFESGGSGGEIIDAGTTFVDSSASAKTPASIGGNAQLDSADSKFGTVSLLCDGTGDWLRYADSDDWNFAAGDFTIDCWVKRSATGTKFICGQANSTPTTTTWSHSICFTALHKLEAQVYNAAGTKRQLTGPTSLTDTASWHHVALVRDGNTLRLFLDGVSEATLDVTGFTIVDSANQLGVGNLGEYVTNPWQGWIDEFRISKGIARWTAGFTPPVAPYTSDGFTVLLLHFDVADTSTLIPFWLARATRNPAWAYLDALRGNANKRPIPDARIDLPAFIAWAADCDVLAQDGEASFTFDAVFDFEGTLFDALRAIASAGRASFAMVDGKFSIVQDQPQTVPIQHFTPRNSFGFKGTKAFDAVVHALKVQFVNEDAGWQKDEATVYADGYTEANATLFEALETFGITRYAQAWREGRYHQAVAILRPESYQISCDIEHIVCKRGDLIRVSHDAPLWGSGWGRVKAVLLDVAQPQYVTAVTLDETVTMEAGPEYVIRIRGVDGASWLHRVETAIGDWSTLYLTNFIDVSDAKAPAVGDLVMFGVYTLESIEGIVLSILPEADFGARITFADAAPNIHLAYSGAIPPFVSGITQPVPAAQGLPALPIIESVRSDETALLLMPDGSLLTRILVILGAQSTAQIATASIEVQFRRSDTDGAWTRMPLLPSGAGLTEISVMPVSDGAFYDVRLRAVSAIDTASDWVGVSNHLVVGNTTPPPDVTNLRREGDWLRWTYTDRPRDFAGFFVRHRPGTSAEWDDALALHDGILGASEITIDTLIGSGTRTIMVKAVDVAGNLSATPATLLLDLGTPIVGGVINTYDFAGSSPAFSLGDIVNGTVVAGQLVADGLALFWSGNDAALFWPASDAALFWTDSAFAEMTYTVVFTPAGNEVGARLTLVADVSAGVWSFLYRAGALGSFVPWPGELVLEAGGSPQQEYELRIQTGADSTQGVIRTFVGTVDVPAP